MIDVKAGDRTRRRRITLQGCRDGKDGLEILAITAGEGNGWIFSAEVLHASTALWDGVECFIDHDWKSRSLRDLAGVCFNPRWSEEHLGVRLSLRPLGPAAGLLCEAALEMSAQQTRTPRIGFSADIVFSAAGNQVTRVEKVLSVDLVVNPARGGEFILEPGTDTNSHFSIQEEHMQEGKLIANGTLSGETSIREDNQACQTIEGMEDGAHARIQMCACLLDATLAAARLPAAAENSLRTRFGGTVFEPSALQQALSETRALMSELTGGAVIQGAGHVNVSATPEDQVAAALHDLLGSARPAGLETVKTARLSGIRELYTLMTGDTGFNGGYYSERA